jgi:hypothetical protein
VANVGFGPGHQEPDINNYVIFARDEWLVIDPGYTKLKETRNYNTLLVNGYGQAGAGRKFLDYMAFESRHPAPGILYAKSHAQFDYLIGDAGNIYVDEAGVEYFRRHLVFLRPDVVVIADDVLAEKRSVFDWLLQVNEIAAIDDLGGRIRVTKNGVEFWIIPVLPEDLEISVHHRKLEAKDVHGLPGHREGILKTIRLRSESQRARFMVMIGIQNVAGLQAPVVAMENNQISITINGQERRLEYMSAASSKEPFLKLLP